jgi:hypothetical protein
MDLKKKLLFIPVSSGRPCGEMLGAKPIVFLALIACFFGWSRTFPRLGLVRLRVATSSDGH